MHPVADHPPQPVVCQVATPKNWISASEAATLLEVARGSIPRIARAGRVRVKQLPGINQTLYSRDDFLNVLHSSIRTAGEVRNETGLAMT